MRSRATFLLALAFGSVGACSTFGSTDTVTTDDGGVDGSSVSLEAASPDASSSVDGGSCTTVIDDHFDPPEHAEWHLLGDNAAIDPNRKQLTLTPGDSSKDGAGWWSLPITFETYLRVKVDFSTSTNAVGGKPGEGLSVAWVGAQHPPIIGDLGKSFAICNADGGQAPG